MEAGSLFTAHASNMLVTLYCTLVVILWFLIVIYIARLSTMSDPSTPSSSSPRVLLISTRKRVMLSSPHYGIPRFLCLFSDVVLSTLTWIHLSPISFLMNSIICLCFSMFSILNVLSVCFIIGFLDFKENCNFWIHRGFLLLIFGIAFFVLLFFF